MKRFRERQDDLKYGPKYDVGSTKLGQFRAVANRAGGLMKLERFYRVQYAEAVEAAVRASLRWPVREATFKAMCASGTFHSDGEDIHKAILSQQRARLAAYPAQERRKRTAKQWAEMYAQALQEKRARQWELQQKNVA